jgi:hypothetical protein
MSARTHASVSLRQSFAPLFVFFIVVVAFFIVH